MVLRTWIFLPMAICVSHDARNQRLWASHSFLKLLCSSSDKALTSPRPRKLEAAGMRTARNPQEKESANAKNCPNYLLHKWSQRISLPSQYFKELLALCSLSRFNQEGPCLEQVFEWPSLSNIYTKHIGELPLTTTTKHLFSKPPQTTNNHLFFQRTPAHE